jgi:hypothetical protein
MVDLNKIVDQLSNLTVQEATTLAAMLNKKWNSDGPRGFSMPDNLERVERSKKIPKVGKCIHCLKDPVELTADHMFPRAWYPDTTPENLEKWQIPSCGDCNGYYGKIEGDLLNRVALALDTSHPASAGLADAALRAMNPSAARDERDTAARAAQAKKILRELYRGEEIPENALIPGLGERWGRPKTEQLAIQIPSDSLKRVTEKIVRGLVYREGKKFIEMPYEVKTYVVGDSGAGLAIELLDKAGTVFRREPGFEIRRVLVEGGEYAGIYEVNFWQQFKIYATVATSDERSSKQ